MHYRFLSASLSTLFPLFSFSLKYCHEISRLTERRGKKREEREGRNIDCRPVFFLPALLSSLPSSWPIRSIQEGRGGCMEEERERDEEGWVGSIMGSRAGKRKQQSERHRWGVTRSRVTEEDGSCFPSDHWEEKTRERLSSLPSTPFVIIAKR